MDFPGDRALRTGVGVAERVAETEGFGDVGWIFDVYHGHGNNGLTPEFVAMMARRMVSQKVYIGLRRFQGVAGYDPPVLTMDGKMLPMEGVWCQDVNGWIRFKADEYDTGESYPPHPRVDWPWLYTYHAAGMDIAKLAEIGPYTLFRCVAVDRDCPSVRIEDDMSQPLIASLPKPRGPQGVVRRLLAPVVDPIQSWWQPEVAGDDWVHTRIAVASEAYCMRAVIGPLYDQARAKVMAEFSNDPGMTALKKRFNIAWTKIARGTLNHVMWAGRTEQVAAQLAARADHHSVEGDLVRVRAAWSANNAPMGIPWNRVMGGLASIIGVFVVILIKRRFSRWMVVIWKGFARRKPPNTQIESQASICPPWTAIFSTCLEWFKPDLYDRTQMNLCLYGSMAFSAMIEEAVKAYLPRLITYPLFGVLEPLVYLLPSSELGYGTIRGRMAIAFVHLLTIEAYDDPRMSVAKLILPSILHFLWNVVALFRADVGSLARMPWKWGALTIAGAGLAYLWRKHQRRYDGLLEELEAWKEAYNEGLPPEDDIPPRVYHLSGVMALPAKKLETVNQPPPEKRRGELRLKIGGEEVDRNTFIGVLGQGPVTTKIHCFATTNAVLHRPENGPVAMLSALEYRVCAAPFEGESDIESHKARVEELRKRWRERVADTPRTLWPRVCEVQSPQTFVEKFSGWKRTVYDNALRNWLEGRVWRSKGMQPKSDEVVKLQHLSGSDLWQPKTRAITVFAPELNTVVGPWMEAFSLALKELWNVSVIHDLGRRGQVMMVYGSGRSTREISLMVDAMVNSPCPAVMVAGDDSLIFIPEHGWYEIDLAMCDQTLGEGPLFECAKTILLEGGIDPAIWELLEEATKANAKYLHRRTQAEIAVVWCAVQMSTGIPMTTVVTSLVVGHAYLYSVLAFMEKGTELAQTLEYLGMKPKVKFSPYGPYGMTFLKGVFMPLRDGSRQAWCPLIGAVCKYGKLMDSVEDATRGYPGDYPSKLRLVARSYAASMVVCRSFPVLGAYKCVLERLGGEGPATLAVVDRAYAHKPRVLRLDESDIEDVDREAAMCWATERYGLSRAEIEDCESLIWSVRSLPFHLQHRVFSRVALVDAWELIEPSMNDSSAIT
jgi:hypothetical protein